MSLKTFPDLVITSSQVKGVQSQVIGVINYMQRIVKCPMRGLSLRFETHDSCLTVTFTPTDSNVCGGGAGRVIQEPESNFVKDAAFSLGFHSLR